MKKEKILDKIKYPADLRKIKIEDLKHLSNELREELIDVVSTTGGHLGAGLGGGAAPGGETHRSAVGEHHDGVTTASDHLLSSRHIHFSRFTRIARRERRRTVRSPDVLPANDAGAIRAWEHRERVVAAAAQPQRTAEPPTSQRSVGRGLHA